MKKVYSIVTIIAIIILAYIFQDWLRAKIIVSLGGYTTQKIDTVTTKKYIKGKIDTTAVFNHYVSTHGINLHPEPKIIYKDSAKWKQNKISDSIEKIKEFEVAINDSIIRGTLTIQNSFTGDLLFSRLDYIPIYPKFLSRVDTLKLTNTITRSLSTDRAKFGAGIGYDFTGNNIQLLGSYTLKNGMQFIYEFETPLQNNIFNGIPQQKSHSIKFLYNF